MTTIPGILAERLERTPDATAIVDGDVRLNFAQLGSLAASVAAGLVDCGVERGDRVAVWLPNRYEWIVSALGAQMAGAALVPVNTRFRSGEVREIVGRTRARVVIAPVEFLGVDYLELLAGAAPSRGAAPLLDGLPHLQHVFAVGAAGAERYARPWEELVAQNATHEQRGWNRASEVGDADASDILFTSGTTGRPKGAVCIHGVTVAAYRCFCEVVGLDAGDRYLIVNPFFHAFGYKAGWLAALMVGACAFPMAVFDVDEALELIERERITVFPATPTVYNAILARPDLGRWDLSSLRLSVTGATSVPAQLVRDMQEMLSFRHILVGYGLTEASGLGTMCRPGDDPDTVAETSGPPMKGMELVIRSETNVEPGPDGIGEILLRGHLMSGYFEDDAATVEAIDGDGWLHTGDLGFLDARGYLHVTGRKKDMLIVGGFNVYPAEVEGMLLEDERIFEVAVVGVPDTRMGEVGCAFVVLRPGARIDADEIVALCRSRMANFKVPRVVWICDELPRTANGKVRKDLLRERGATMAHGEPGGSPDPPTGTRRRRGRGRPT